MITMGLRPTMLAGVGDSGSSIWEICDLHDLASGVIGGPFADLFSAFEVTGAQFAAIQPEPLPVPFKLTVHHVALGFDTSVLVAVNSFFHAFIRSTFFDERTLAYF